MQCLWRCAPQVLRGVTQEMRVAREETFGPVVALAPFDGAEATAIELANDTESRARTWRGRQG